MPPKIRGGGSRGGSGRGAGPRHSTSSLHSSPSQAQYGSPQAGLFSKDKFQKAALSFDEQGNYLCMVCNDTIDDKKHDSIQCFACKGWEHKDCFRMKDKYDDLTSDYNLHYVCTPCLTGENVAPMPSSIDGKLTALMGLLPMVSSLSRRIEKVEQNLVGAKLEKKIDEIVDKKLDQKVSEALDEKIDIESREKNLMFVNVVESDKPNDPEKKVEDAKMVKELFCGIEDIEDDEIADTMRMGKPGQKPRMLRVTFKSKEKRNKVLSKAGNMNSDLHVVDGGRIFVNPDLTANQRVRFKALRDELAERKARGEKNIGIKDFKIVQKKRYEYNQNDAIDTHDIGRAPGGQAGATGHDNSN